MTVRDDQAVTVRNVVDLDTFVSAPDRLALHYHPEVDLSTGKLVGFGARLMSETGPVATGDLVAASETVVATRGAWTLERACHDLAGWFERGLPMCRISTRLGAAELASPGTLEFVAEALGVTGVPASLVEVTIDESSLATPGVVRAFEALGCRVAVGPFGAAPTSIAALEASGIAALSLDDDLVARVGVDPGARTVAGAIIAMAHALGASVVAPNVGSMETLTFLQRRRCDAARGPQVSRALAASEVVRWYREWRGARLRLSA